VFGVLAGAVLPFFVGLFNAFDALWLVVGLTLLAYLLGRRFLEPRVPAVLPALVVAIVSAGFTGGLGTPPTEVAFPVPEITLPVFSLAALLTATPVIVVLITLQANASSVVFLRAQGYNPPERGLTVVSGGGTLLASLFGPMGISLSLPATAITAGPDVGDSSTRQRAVVLGASFAIAIGLLAAYAADLEALIARPVLLAVLGLAVVGVFTGALRKVASGPLTLGPVFAFGIAVSDLSLLGLGSFFWALVLGLLISRFVERDAWAELQAQARHA
jgi:benzoate membrane transport protein